MYLAVYRELQHGKIYTLDFGLQKWAANFVYSTRLLDTLQYYNRREFVYNCVPDEV